MENMKIDQEFSIVVNYEEPIEKEIKKRGVSYFLFRFGKYPMGKKGRNIAINLNLIKFEKNFNATEIIYKMEKEWMRPANLSELVSSDKLVQLSDEFPIFALGSINRIGNNRYLYCPYLSNKRLYEQFLGYGFEKSLSARFPTICRFAAVSE